MDTCNIKCVATLDVLLKTFGSIHFDILNIIHPILVVVTSASNIVVVFFNKHTFVFVFTCTRRQNMVLKTPFVAGTTTGVTDSLWTDFVTVIKLQTCEMQSRNFTGVLLTSK